MNLARELEQQQAAAEERLQLVMQVLQAEPTALNRFMAHFNAELAAMEQMVTVPDGAAAAKETIHALFRKAHTLKGEASLLRLVSHARALHQLEDQLENLRAASSLGEQELASLVPSLQKLQELGEQIRQALDQLKSLETTSHIPIKSAPEKSNDLVGTLEQLISDLSGRLAKPVIFHASLNQAEVPPHYVDVLKEALLHLVRNSMVHGIETTEERLKRGKNPQGTLQLELRIHPEVYEIVFQDDGGGLNYEKIRRRGEKLGWHLVADEELRQAIFEPGFSTAESVTDLAGRGVGLDVIRNSLGKLGGRIIPHSQEGAYCAFQIVLPKLPHSPAV